MLVVNPAFEGVTEDWFDPQWWGDNAQPVSTGGRGSAWFVSSDQGEMVLRHYRRGGLVARFSEQYYVYTGWQKTRSFREFELTKLLYGWGLPVPEPVAACAVRNWFCYRAGILIRRIPGAVPLPEVDDLGSEDLWRNVGKTIRRFHDVGLDHVDLNCDNILVASGKVYLIDFDRCRLLPRRTTEKRGKWNLQRLRRSIEKRAVRLTERQTTFLWDHLLESYERS